MGSELTPGDELSDSQQVFIALPPRQHAARLHRRSLACNETESARHSFDSLGALAD